MTSKTSCLLACKLLPGGLFFSPRGVNQDSKFCGWKHVMRGVPTFDYQFIWDDFRSRSSKIPQGNVTKLPSNKNCTCRMIGFSSWLVSRMCHVQKIQPPTNHPPNPPTKRTRIWHLKASLASWLASCNSCGCWKASFNGAPKGNLDRNMLMKVASQGTQKFHHQPVKVEGVKERKSSNTQQKIKVVDCGWYENRRYSSVIVETFF